MRINARALAFVLGLALSALSSHAQTPSSDQLNAIKNLPQDQQDALLQSGNVRTDASGRRVDQKLATPQTTLPKTDQGDDVFERYRQGKTKDGRVLRVIDEDPELRPEDTVLIDLTPIDSDLNDTGPNAQSTRNQNQLNSQSAGYFGLPGTATADQNGAMLSSNTTDSDNRKDSSRYRERATNDFGRIRADVKAKSDDEKKKSDDLRELILKNNPYKLNRFGVLEMPGLPAIPLAGLTSDEATNRLAADPDLRDFRIKLTLLRLQPFDEEALKPFGYDLFEGVPSTFAPVSDIQVPSDYAVGPGDTLNIQLYGNEPASYGLTVGRDGRVNFPKLGPIMVSGMSFDRARAAIEQQVNQQLIGSRVSVTMGDLRAIRVFVLGEAQKPGSFTVSGLSTMTNALFVSGGVKKIGSLRKIELRRNGHLVAVLDLYDLLLHGNTVHDQQLLPGDVIFVPPIGDTVSIYGAVRRPAIYELNGERDVEQIIAVAGGLLPDADSKLVQLERIQPSRQRQMRNIDLTAPGVGAERVQNGDKLRVQAIRPTLENSVTLKGFVYRPGSFEFHAGMRLSDVLPTFDELRPNADRHYVMIRRERPPEQKVEVISADLERALLGKGSAADVELQPRDQVMVFDLSASRERIVAPTIRDLELQASPDKPAQVVSIDGHVKAPGRYPLEPSMHVSDLVRAGGSLDDASFVNEAELTRYKVVNGDSRQIALLPIDLEAIRRGDKSADVSLQPYDVLVIKVTPQWEQPGSIVLTGELRFPGKYPIHRGETVSSILKRAGGFTEVAFVEGAVFTREELKKREKDQLEMLSQRLQSDLSALSLEAVSSSAATSNAAGAAGATQALAIGQQLISQLKQTKPVGRLVIDLNKVVRGPLDNFNDVAVRDGDKIFLPKQTQEITILGEVQSPTSHIYQMGLSRDDYIAKSGGITQKADKKRIYVVRANGDVLSGERSGWFRRSHSVEIRPGDTIIVPLDTERVRALPLWQAVTTIIYNLAVALLAVRSV